MTDRLWSKIDRRGPDECWPWTASIRQGYGQYRDQGRPRGAHVVVHELVVGPVPVGHVVDHTCHDPAVCPGGPGCPHRSCCNPRHLRSTSNAVNTGAGRSVAALPRTDVCVRGHSLLDESNVYRHGRGRHCRRCAIDRATEWNRLHRRRA